MKLWRKSLSLLLALCLVCGVLSACDWFADPAGNDLAEQEDDDAFVHLTGMTYQGSPYYTPVTSRYAYDQLSERQQALYNLLVEQVYTISPEKGEPDKYPMKAVVVPGQLNVAQLRVVFRALSDDNPYFFWLSQTFSHLSNLDENYTRVIAYSEFPPDTVAAMIAQTDEVIGAFYAEVPAGLDDYEREKLVHDYVLECCEYDREVAAMTKPSERSVRGHSVYGALVDGRCVCEGYGGTMQLLLNGLGVDCVTLTGTSHGGDAGEELHLWNAVSISGDWYHVDPTWDDQDQAIQRYDYFNLDDETLLLDHSLSLTPDELGEDVIMEKGTEDMNIFIPSCSRREYNYYVHECPHMTSYDDYEVAEGLYQAAMERAESYTFYIDPDYLDYDAAVSLLFKESPQYFFSYTERVNDRLYDYEIDDSNMTYYPNKNRSCVTVTLRYY